MFVRRLTRELVKTELFVIALVAVASLGTTFRPYEQVFLGILLLGLALGGGYLLIIERRNRLALLSERDILSDRDMYARYCRGMGLPESDVTAALHRIGETLRVDAGRLRPQDELRTLLAIPDWVMPWEWGDPGRLLAMVGVGDHEDESRRVDIRTIDDILRALVATDHQEDVRRAA